MIHWVLKFYFYYALHKQPFKDTDNVKWYQVLDKRTLAKAGREAYCVCENELIHLKQKTTVTPVYIQCQ